ncbi:hypothetical protein ACM55O_06160 [Hafnia paralvei]|uniref:hypothetical protein n=1 Tax=Hafnia paralvei TaxID=546367 RepID=UPI0039FC78DE
MGEVFRFSREDTLVENLSKPPHTVKNGDGGGNDMLEARVAKLEANVEHIASDTTDIKMNLRKTSSDVSDLKTELALTKRDTTDIKANTDANKANFEVLATRMKEVEDSINSFKTTVKVGVGVISAAVVIFGIIAGPYLAKIAQIINSLALKN